MRAMMLAAVLALALPIASADAAQIAAFGQTSGANTLTATVNAADTVTTLTIANAGLDVTQLFGMSPLAGLSFSLDAMSIDAVASVGGALLQHYSGSFCITSAAGCTGSNILSGTFSDAAFGAAGGTGLVVNVSNPPDTLTLTSSVLSAADLAAPNSFNLGFSNLTPALASLGTTIAPFTASFAGTVSSSVKAVPEPASVALLGMGLLGVAALRKRARA
jgi:hypothetical protein